MKGSPESITPRESVACVVYFIQNNARLFGESLEESRFLRYLLVGDNEPGVVLSHRAAAVREGAVKVQVHVECCSSPLNFQVSCGNNDSDPPGSLFVSLVQRQHESGRSFSSTWCSFKQYRALTP
jgi:hypothetical protein